MKKFEKIFGRLEDFEIQKNKYLKHVDKYTKKVFRANVRLLFIFSDYSMIRKKIL